VRVRQQRVQRHQQVQVELQEVHGPRPGNNMPRPRILRPWCRPGRARRARRRDR
jgi:hypothetical protein